MYYSQDDDGECYFCEGREYITCRVCFGSGACYCGCGGGNCERCSGSGEEDCPECS